MARRLSGVGQVILAVAGAVWMVAVMVQFFSAYIRLLQVPPDWRSYLDSGLGGLFIFLTGWAWSVVTGIWLLRAASRAAKPLQSPPGGSPLPPKI